MMYDDQIEKLQAVLIDDEACRFNFASFEAIPLPLDPEVRIKGIIPESASLFKVSPDSENTLWLNLRIMLEISCYICCLQLLA